MEDKWTLKHRPKSLDDFFGHQEVVHSLKKLAENGSMQDILFFGPAGTGKTTLARIYATMRGGNILDLNASKDNGVDVIRDKVSKRAKAQTLDGSPQIIFLDEQDNMTTPAQEALRRTMEDFGNNCIFIISTNDIESTIDPIKSRCKGNIFEVPHLDGNSIGLLIKDISKKEGLKIDNSDIIRIVEESGGDARAAVDMLESLAYGSSQSFYRSREERFSDLTNGICDSVDSPIELVKLIKESELSDYLRYLINEIDSHDTIIQMAKLIGDTDIAMQKSHNKDIHLFNMFVEARKCLT